MNEIDLIEKIRRLAAKGPQIAVGIGDDCAVFRPRAGRDLLFKTDPLIEDIHFKRDLAPAIVGHRALARNLSDIAAMGGDPRFCLVSLAVTGGLGERWISGFFRGLMSLAKRTGTALAGGHLARAEKIFCDVIVCGSVPRGQALLRSGARPGDALYVSGTLGRPWDRRFEPRLALGRSLRGRASSCIDVSDGLSLDLFRLCRASKVAAEVDRVPITRGASLERALHGGEDYELLFTMPEGRKAPPGTARIGTIIGGKPGAVRFRGEPLEPRGHDHFRR
ncbi:MAG TPA: thiamine-phosphate kinase [Bryobacteraceae bacterium]|nr:thiamine-phosphate kinase [Bryobacteraceae bacterium]